MNALEKNVARKLVPFYTNPEKDNSYTLYVNPETKTIFKADAKNISPSKITLLIILGYPMIEFFPINVIPFDNIMAYLCVSILAMFLSVLIGYYISPYMLENYRRVYMTADEWKDCLKIINHFYVRQLLFPSILLLISIACFLFLYVYPTSWLFFIGIISGILAGAGITSFSKTKYLLYKNKLDINLNNGGEEDEDITYW